MNPSTVSQTYTPEDLLAMPNGDDFELVKGELVERNIGWDASWIGGRLHHSLSTFCDAANAGWVAPADASYQCFPDDPEKVRKRQASWPAVFSTNAMQAATSSCSCGESCSYSMPITPWKPWRRSSLRTAP